MLSTSSLRVLLIQRSFLTFASKAVWLSDEVYENKYSITENQTQTSGVGTNILTTDTFFSKKLK